MSSLRAAHKYLLSLCRSHPELTSEQTGLQTTFALAIAAAKVCSFTRALGITLHSAAPPGLESLWDAAGRVGQSHPALWSRIESDALGISAEELGPLYEASLHAEVISKRGLFFTPTWLASELTARTLTEDSGAILDPACGGGAFLLAALEQLRNRRGYHNALRCLYGVDIDPHAAAVCRAALLCRIGSWPDTSAFMADAEIVASQVRHADALLDAELVAQLSSEQTAGHATLSWRQVFEPVARGGFDAVLGNPPYGLSRGEKIAAPEKLLLRQMYQQWVSGKINKYLLFMARGYELLRAGGRLGYVVPNSWLGISNATALRRHLLQDGALEQISDYSELLFETAGVEVVTVIAQKQRRGSSITINRRCATGVVSGSSFEFSNSSFQDDFRIPLRWNQASEEIVTLISQRSIPLGAAASPVVPRIALQAYARGKGSPPQTAEIVRRRPFDTRDQDGPDVYPYYQGSDIERYALRWSGGYLRHGPFLAEPQELTRFTGPRIVIREILGAAPHLFHAAFLEETALYNKSVLHITPKSGTSRETILAVLGVLNSKVASVVIAHRGKKSQRRLFPKILNADLREFPLPQALLVNGAHLAALVAQRLVADEQQIAELEAQIEAEVLRLYGVETQHFGLNLDHATTGP